MVKRTKQLISKETVEKCSCHPEFDEGCNYYYTVILRQAQYGKGFLRKSEALIRVKVYSFFFLFSISLLFINGCANQLPPGGGEVDLVPPSIISSHPENGSTNFNDDYIEFEFSEYVDKRAFRDALFISPAMDEQPEISWSGTSVEIEFPGGLKDSITYVVTIGTDVVDVNNKNRMANSFSLTFATGDKIDKRSIDGKVYGKDIEGTLIFAYKFFDDTTKYLSNKPDYLSQIGKDGTFQLKGLAESVYRVFAVKDEFRDFIYQADQDLIGIPNKEISLLSDDSTYSGLNFFLTKVDTVEPRLLSTVMTDQNHLVITLSEECDSSTYNADNFQIIDSTSNQVFPVAYSYQTKANKEEFVLVHKNKLNVENNYFLLAKKIQDLNGNAFLNEISSFVVSDKPDTTALNLVKSEPGKNGVSDFKNPEIRFYFDDAVDNKEIKNAIQFTDTSKNVIDFNLVFVDDATIIIKPFKDLKPEKFYDIRVDLNDFTDAAGNRNDSTYHLRFQTITGVEFTGISGKLTTSKSNVILVLQNPKDEKKFYTVEPDKTLTYSFERIEAGTYSLWLYSDIDSSKSFSTGYPDPFKYSEEFKFVADTIKLRPRWSITDYDIVFD
ncbi:MAG: Ig-like domain-containing protein [Ignavibacterium sp.]|jgi:hypothetical protein|nr:Ig-like domain-containing protein [Ignavibacterium sp.]